MSKQDYIRDPELFRLDPSRATGLSLEERTIADIIYTAGSSGEPTPFYDTVHDRYARIDLMARATRIAGIGPADTVMNLFPLSAVPHQGFLERNVGADGNRQPSCSAASPAASYAGFPVHRRMDEAIDLIEEPARHSALGHHLATSGVSSCARKPSAKTSARCAW